MKKPEKINFDWFEVLKKAIEEKTVTIFDSVAEGNTELSIAIKKAINEYEYWDKVKYYEIPDKITPEILWSLVKYRKLNMNHKDIFIGQEKFKYFESSAIHKKISIIYRHSSRYSLSSEEESEYSANSMMEEGIASSQLEGAAETREVAKEMLRTNSKPVNRDQQMILNNYRAMEYIEEKCNEILSPDKIKRIHKIITEKTLENEEKAGTFRKEEDNIKIVDSRDNTLLHTPPAADNIDSMLDDLCSYANSSDEDDFTHPVIKAVIVHFWFAYIHPFVDGNGRTARALFYWCMLRNNYKSFKYLVISGILKEKPARYARAFLYTEIDENDLTYFINFNLDVILEAIMRFNEYVQKKNEENKKTVSLIESDIELNFRQRSIIKEFIKERNSRNIEYFKNKLNVVYETARRDLDFLTKKGFLKKKKVGKQFIYSLSKNLSEKVSNNNINA